MDVYSLHIPYMGSDKCLTQVSWSIWWNINTLKNNEFSIGQTAELIHLVTTEMLDRGKEKPGSEGKQNCSFSSCLLLNQLNYTLCEWFQEQSTPGQFRYSWKGQGLLQPRSAATSFLVVSSIIVHCMSQIWKVKCKKKSATLVEWYGPLHHTCCWHKRGKRNRNVTALRWKVCCRPQNGRDIWEPQLQHHHQPFCKGKWYYAVAKASLHHQVWGTQRVHTVVCDALCPKHFYYFPWLVLSNCLVM